MRSSSHKDFLRSQTVIKRRRKRRIVRLWMLAFVIIALCALLVWAASRPGILIKRIVVVGNVDVSSDDIQSAVNAVLDQSYAGMFPKRNALIYPKSAVRAAILSAYPRIDDLSMYTESFEVLNIKVHERDAVAVWCAAVKCYLVDGSAYIYAEKQDYPSGAVVGTSSASSTGLSAVSPLQAEYDALPVMYGGDDSVGPDPVGKSVFNPKLFGDLVRSFGEIQKLGDGFKVKDIHVFSRDEIVFDLASGGKIIFADRKPFDDSLEDLKSALKSSVFSSSSAPQFEYIDTRFGNKVFYRLRNSGESAIPSTSTKTNI